MFILTLSAREAQSCGTFQGRLFTAQRETVSFVVLSKDVDLVGSEGEQVLQNHGGGIAGQRNGNVVASDVFSLAVAHQVRQDLGSRRCPGGAEASGRDLRELQGIWWKQT